MQGALFSASIFSTSSLPRAFHHIYTSRKCTDSILLSQNNYMQPQMCPIISTITKCHSVVAQALLHSWSAHQLGNKEELKWEPHVIHKNIPDGYQSQEA